MQITTQEILSDQVLLDEWTKTAPSATKSIGQALILKMLHSQYKEFARNTRTLETIEEGKSADVDVSLRTKLKTHASDKHLNLK